MMNKLVLFVCLAVNIATAQADLLSWSTTGPDAARWVTIGISNSKPAVVYAGVAGPGPVSQDGRISKSVDGGLTWVDASSGLPGSKARSIAVAPDNPSIAYASLFTDGLLYKTVDGGSNWFQLSPATFAQVGLGDVAIDPKNASTIMVVGANFLFKSMDGGITWTKSKLIANAQSVIPISLAIDPATPSTIYVGVLELQLTSLVSRLLKSTDGGSTWAITAFPTVTNLSIQDIQVDPRNHSILFAAAQGPGGGFYRSTDAGMHWVQINNGIPSSSFALANSIVIDSINTNTLYAADLVNGVFQSTDAGATWLSMNSGLPPAGSIRVYSLEIDPANPSMLFAGTETGIYSFLAGRLEMVLFRPLDPCLPLVGGGVKAVIWGQFGERKSLVAASGEKLEVECGAAVLNPTPDTTTQVLAALQLFYTSVSGFRFRVGICPFDGGCNTILFGYGRYILPVGGTVGVDDKPDRFIMTRWISRDYFFNDDHLPGGNAWTGQPRDSSEDLVDWADSVFVVGTNSLTKTSYKFEYTNGYGPLLGPRCIDVANGSSLPPEGSLARAPVIVDPPVGPETEAFFDGVQLQLSQNTVSGEPMSGITPLLCDLNVDLICDASDVSLFEGVSQGQCRGDADYQPLRDIDGNGCISSADGLLIFGPFANAGKSGVARVGSTIQLDGHGSLSAAGASSLQYRWTQVGGAPVSLSDETSQMPTIISTTPGFYSFHLVVSDGVRNSNPDGVVITVPKLGDIDLDGDIDKVDLASIIGALNSTASGPNDTRDLDGDGMITALDARKLVTLCTRLRCATE